MPSPSSSGSSSSGIPSLSSSRSMESSIPSASESLAWELATKRTRMMRTERNRRDENDISLMMSVWRQWAYWSLTQDIEHRITWPGVLQWPGCQHVMTQVLLSWISLRRHPGKTRHINDPYLLGSNELPSATPIFSQIIICKIFLDHHAQMLSEDNPISIWPLDLVNTSSRKYLSNQRLGGKLFCHIFLIYFVSALFCIQYIFKIPKSWYATFKNSRQFKVPALFCCLWCLTWYDNFINKVFLWVDNGPGRKLYVCSKLIINFWRVSQVKTLRRSRRKLSRRHLISLIQIMMDRSEDLTFDWEWLKSYL